MILAVGMITQEAIDFVERHGTRVLKIEEGLCYLLVFPEATMRHDSYWGVEDIFWFDDERGDGTGKRTEGLVVWRELDVGRVQASYVELDGDEESPTLATSSSSS